MFKLNYCLDTANILQGPLELCQAGETAVQQTATVLHYYHYMYATCTQPGLVP